MQRDTDSGVRGAAVLGGLAVFGAVALLNRAAARRANKVPLPRHRFLTVGGTRLHYIDRGAGRPVVLLHGTGAMAEDFELSGLANRLARRYRVIAFDRPGFGYSDALPPSCPEPEVIHQAMQQLGLDGYVIVGHSSGTLPVLSIALDHPEHIVGVVLLSGYYFVRGRPDVAAVATMAAPVLRDIVAQAMANLFGWLALPGYIRKVFAPEPVPPWFDDQFPAAAVLRPSHLRASLVQTLQMKVAAAALRDRYRGLRVPAAILAGTADRIVTTELQSARLHALLPASELHRIEGAGHMVHYSAPEQVAAAVEAVERAGAGRACAAEARSYISARPVRASEG